MDFSRPNSEKERVLVLGGEEYREGEPWQFLSWKCRDYSYGGKILVEVGKVTLPHDYKNTVRYQELSEEEKQGLDKFVSSIGFVLYDGTDTGDLTLYNREGLSHRWDWEGERGNYSVVIKADGTGLYYDFSTAENGVKHKADDLFKCSR